MVGEGKTRLEKDQCLDFFNQKFSLDVFSEGGELIAEITPGGASKIVTANALLKSNL